MRILSVILAFVLLPSCENSEQSAKLSEDYQKDLKELSNELREQARLMSSCQLDVGGQDRGDCAAIGFNPKPCGGYYDFITLSQNSNNDGQNTLKRPSDDYLFFMARLRVYQDRIEFQNREQGLVSTCEVTEAPRARCNAERKCVLERIPEFSPPDGDKL